MPATVYRGKKAAVSFGPEGEGVTYPFDTWSLIVRADPIDSSDFDQPSRNFKHDLPSGTVTIGGPYTDEVMDIKVSDVVEITLFLDEEGNIGFPVTTLLTECSLRTDVRGAARLEISGVVTGNIMESVADAFTKEVIL